MARATIAYMHSRSDARAAPRAPLDGRGLDVIEVVRDRSPDERRGLGRALGRIAAGEASTLLVARLADVARSRHELLALLEWLDAAGAGLRALDVGLDSSSPGGRRTIAVLREVERWEREPATGRPPRGRPGIAARAPELSERIGALREEGLSLQAIADTLNDEEVPTQRGGARWRPSSVQAALGYRRPRPPLPGAPPPHPPVPHRHPPGESPHQPRSRPGKPPTRRRGGARP